MIGQGGLLLIGPNILGSRVHVYGWGLESIHKQILDERNNIVVGPNAECGGAALGG
jgi:hypothetical protein